MDYLKKLRSIGKVKAPDAYRRVWTIEKDRELRDLKESGHTNKEIAQLWGVPLNRINTRASALGLRKQTTGRRYK